ncbi:MAG: 3-isopropylmalate dehydratase small subunit [Pseudomonadota bacterium]|jgi:3-isopropylmalate/(R)-2-methylmalate dehydratase small subunit
MERFSILVGVAAPLLRPNVDTDAIIPSREMKSVSKTGLAGGLFANWRYSDVAARVENPDFVLNQPAYRRASILLAGTNFGCGSSREHAVWALREWGIRCIVAPAFGGIFQSNCVRNGILPVMLGEAVVAELAAQTAPAPANRPLTVDLVACTLTAPDGTRHPFPMDPGDRAMLLEGLDAIGLTLKRAAEIDRFETAYLSDRPWLDS